MEVGWAHAKVRKGINTDGHTGLEFSRVQKQGKLKNNPEGISKTDFLNSSQPKCTLASE
jgi:hypothetical protein